MNSGQFDKQIQELKTHYSDYDSHVWNRLLIYLSTLQKWNTVMNLTGFSSDVWVDQIIAESLLLIDLIPEDILVSDKNTFWFDMGSGAGIPGLIIGAVFPNQAMALIDSREKKTDFTLAAAAKMGLKKTMVITERLENVKVLKPQFSSYGSLFFSRALADPVQLVEYAEPYSRKGSVILSPRSGSEIEKPVELLSKKGILWKGSLIAKGVPVSERTVQCIELRRID